MGATDTTTEIRTLRRCIGDIVAMSTLSAVWARASRSAIADSLAQVIYETLAADAVYVALRGSSAAPPCVTARGITEARGLPDPIRITLTNWLHDSAGDAEALTTFDATREAQITPIGIAGEHGVIVTVSADEDFRSDTHRLLLNVAANQATLALLTQAARDQQRISDILQRIGTSVASELDLEKVVQAVTDEATALTGADFGAFFYNVVNAAGESYMLYALSGAPREAFSQFPMPRKTAIFGPTFTGTAIVRLDDVTKDPRFGHNAPYFGMPETHLPVRSYLAVPVLSRGGKVHGGLFFGHKHIGMFNERHERLAVGVAAWAALAMDNGDLYAAAQRANRTKDQFLATLSHELRTPLNALVGWLSMVRRPEVMTPVGLPKAWQAIDRNAQALTSLIEDLLDVSRIATGKIHLAQTDVDINEVVRDTVRAVEPEFQEKHVSLSVETVSRPCIIVGDGARLRQTMVNLLSNAVKFTSSGGQVRVRVTCDDRTVVVTVSDTGIGIHPDFLPHVFDQFQQADSNATTGLGLGLAIVKNLIELHGGNVVATSVGIGRGAEFTVTLPRNSHPASASASSAAGHP